MSVEDGLVAELKVIDLSGPPKLFVVSMPAGAGVMELQSVARALDELSLREMGHSIAILASGIELAGLNDLQLRNLGLMRILDARPPEPGTKRQ